MAKQIGFQGEHGAYSELAAKAMLGAEAETIPHRSFDDVFEAVQSGTVDQGLVPIENSLAGSIHRNYDLLQRHSLHIIGETQLRVEHCLIAHPGVALADVRMVRSHPQALAQCEHYLHDLGVEIEAAYDTAGSVRELRDSGARDSAAIASHLAAEVYGLSILCEGIEDDHQNFTRFLLLDREKITPMGDVKTSIVFALHNKPAALFRAMACFALRDIDLTKIESRPIPGSRWQYHFYLDFLASQHEGVGQLAPGQLAEMATELRVLGTYPRAT
jgi:prephenate dehydratase